MLSLCESLASGLLGWMLPSLWADIIHTCSKRLAVLLQKLLSGCSDVGHCKTELQSASSGASSWNGSREAGLFLLTFKGKDIRYSLPHARQGMAPSPSVMRANLWGGIEEGIRGLRIKRQDSSTQ